MSDMNRREFLSKCSWSVVVAAVPVVGFGKPTTSDGFGVLDTFTDANGTLLTDHIPAVGPGPGWDLNLSDYLPRNYWRQ